MKYYLNLSFISLLLSVSVISYGQQLSNDSFAATTGELELKEYEKDKDAEALILYDQGVSKFVYQTDGFVIEFTRHKKIKIFSEPGLQYANVEIPLWQTKDSYENLISIEAVTYNLSNGQITTTKLVPSQVYKEQYNENINVMKFTFPNVREGSVIEYRYVISSPRIFYLPDWYFQDKIPTLQSEYIVWMNPFFTYTWLLQGAKSFDYQDAYETTGIPFRFGSYEYQQNVITYGMRDIPAFRDEKFITSREDYIMKIDFQLSAWSDRYGVTTEVITTWPALCNGLLKDTQFGRFIKQCEKQAVKLIDYRELEKLSEPDRFDRIIDYVKMNYNWNGYHQYMASKSVKKLITEKTGTSADINLLLCGMLRKAGLKADPVLLSTRSHGRIYRDYPFAYSFNYVVVLTETDGSEVLCDACHTFCPDRLLPDECINGEGLLVNKNSNDWVNLVSQFHSNRIMSYSLSLNNTCDSVFSEMAYRFTGYEGMEMRKKYYGEYENIEDILEKQNFTLVDSLTFKNYENRNMPFTYQCRIKHPVEHINDKIYIAPFFNDPISENPFKQESRSYPVDMEYVRNYSFVSQIDIPEGYTIEFLPEDYTQSTKLMRIEYTIKRVSPTSLIVQGIYGYSQAVYDARDYRKLRYYCNEVVKKFNEKIVLVKE